MNLSTLAGVIIALIIVGAVLYVVRLIPIDEWIKQVIVVLVIVFVAIYIVQLLLGISLVKFQ